MVAKKLLLAIAVTAAVSGMVAVDHASAVVKNGICEGNEVCYYDGNNFSFAVYDNDDGTDGNLSNNFFPGTSVVVNNRFNSINNMGANGVSMKVYDGFNGSVFLACVPYGAGINLGTNSDKTSSHTRQTVAGC
jgi:hypothetical protein